MKWHKNELQKQANEMTTEFKQNLKNTAFIGLIIGMAYGMSAGMLTVYSYHNLVPDMFIFPIYSAIFYGLIGLAACTLFIVVIFPLLQTRNLSLSPVFFISANVGWLVAVFLFLVSLDESAIPGQFPFLQNLGLPGMVLLFAFSFLVITLFMLIAIRFVLKGAYKNKKMWLGGLIGLYVFEMVFFYGLNHFKHDELYASTNDLASRYELQNIALEADSTKIMILGVDGADWQILKPLVEEGQTPNFARLMEQGVYGPLKTYEPTKSPVVWSSVATGKNMHKHGIMDFVSRRIPTVSTLFWNYYPLMFGAGDFLDLAGFDTVPVSNNLRKTKAFWNIFNDLDISVGVIGWWPSWPADEVLGFIVSDRFMWDTVNESLEFKAGMTYPDTLVDEIEDRVLSTSQFKHQEELLQFVNLDSAERADLREEIHELKIGPKDESLYPDDIVKTALSYLGWIYLRDENKVNLGLYLHEQYPPQVFAVYLKGIDPVQHAFWRWAKPEKFADVDSQNLSRFKDTIQNYYIHTDKIIGKFLERIDENTIVMVVSDHGFESTPDDGFWKSGGHGKAPEGVVILSGPKIKQNRRLETASVLDMTPTMLYALGLPVAADMDGKVLQDAFVEEFVSQNPIETIPTYETTPLADRSKPLTTTSDEKIKEQLRSLGYIK
ncbi:sulfatase-like hydrolase/transferase [candidate division KSB1 bacterium]|nr:sulfatase-like hydrolase/transferase [candidate division KSB1 bacterium]NIT74345.1 sulfatase-like hydrolase/transferase [candidate division KSB1 bacterium]NIX74025.1 sulfatase-like hydrolase/transferase [candidate division KSB1 bacterium]